jgi:DNA-3-methyladenine glycosylase I
VAVGELVDLGDRSVCWWCCKADGSPIEEYVAYHDDEWGRPVTDDTRLYEKLCLEGFQSGLSWLTILRKRDGFRRAFAGFDPESVARFTDADIERLVGDASIIRHRGKITATIDNARATLQVLADVGSLSALLWSFAPPPGTPPSLAATTPESEAMSKELRRRGFRFVGPTTCYAFMQSMGMVNDHLDGCHARAACDRASQSVPGRRSTSPSGSPR